MTGPPRVSRLQRLLTRLLLPVDPDGSTFTHCALFLVEIVPAILSSY